MNEKPRKKYSPLKIVGNTLFYLVIVMLVVFSIATMQLKSQNDIANLFGFGFMTVQTGSMAGDREDSFTTDDLIFVNLIEDKDSSLIQLDDIVVFYKLDLDDNQANGDQPGFVTHRVVDIMVADGETFFITKGDANSQEDLVGLSVDEILAVYRSKWVGAGAALKYLQTPTGFLVAVVAPVALLLLIQGYVMIKNIIQLNKEKITEHLEKEKEATLKTLELEKEKIRQQILQEMNAQKNQNN
ncbi:MAG: signal peptidase I [Acholeplasma sp.]|jgi:signal peptidase|nr:MAG: signal peptidase I [Acholeplasma sp.]